MKDETFRVYRATNMLFKEYCITLGASLKWHLEKLKFLPHWHWLHISAALVVIDDDLDLKGLPSI